MSEAGEREREVRRGPVISCTMGFIPSTKGRHPGEKGNDMVTLGFQKYLAIQGKPDGKGC